MTSDQANNAPLFQTPDPNVVNPNAGGSSAHETLEAAEKLGLAESSDAIKQADAAAPQGDPSDEEDADKLADRQITIANISAG